jgi:hypothetical protein
LRDDALWMAAVAARRLDQPRLACEDLNRLAQVSPDSRFLGCARLVCPTFIDPERPCRDYIRRQLSTLPDP